MSLPLFALATGSEIILTNECHTVNVQVGLETVVKVLENSKAPHGLHSPFSDSSHQRSGGEDLPGFYGSTALSVLNIFKEMSWRRPSPGAACPPVQ